MSITREFMQSVRVTAVLWGLVSVVYPLLILVVGQLFFPYQANGSLIKNAQGQVVGSALIGQVFTGDRYFQSRPSAVNYSMVNYSMVNPQADANGILRTGISGGSNLAATNPALRDRPPAATADLFYSSASGLDPHITPQGARSQIARIAQTRNLSVQQIDRLVEQNIDDRSLGIFGEPGVNVLKLNLALDQLK